MLHEDDILPLGAESPFLSELHAKNDKTNLFGYILGESRVVIKSRGPRIFPGY